jgi:TonB family protein
MNDAATDAPLWRPKRWLLTGLFIFALQLGLVIFLNDRPSAAATRAHTDTTFRLLPPWIANRRAADSTAGDPTLFVLANAQGFSGRGWLQPAPQQYRFVEWTEPPHWLALNTETLGESFAGYAQAQARALGQLAEQRPLKVPTPLPSADSVATQSVLRVEGELQLRSGMPPSLPSWTHSDLLAHSVVQAGVNEAGEVVSARLVSRSGLAAADKSALDTARGLRFNPFTGPPLKWVKLVFQWRSMAVAATNAPSAALP